MDDTQAILADLEKENKEPVDTQSLGETPAPAAATSQPQLHKYVTRGGKEVEEPIDVILKRAGFGYNYAQDMHALNQERTAFQKEREQIQERIKSLSRWEEYDKYASQNQDWAKHVEESWNNRLSLNNQQQVQDPYAEKFKAFETELADLRRFKDETTQVRTKEQYSQADKQFDEEIQKVGKDYDVDLSLADPETGETLEWRVLDHMEKLGLDGSRQGHFTAAFKDYYFDDLKARQKEKQAEDATKQKVELKKAGILNISRTPNNSASKGYRPGMSWDSAADEIARELATLKA
jgi:hypothetical protein